MAIDVRGVTTLLEVFDMQASIAFYRDLLGFEVVQTWGPDGNWSWAMLRAGHSTLMLNTAYDEGERPAVPDAGRVRGHADTELYVACANVNDVHEHLRQKGHAVNPPIVTHYGTNQIWLTDPDGFRVCFQSPVASS